jgi:hypothetical protein
MESKYSRLSNLFLSSSYPKTQPLALQHECSLSELLIQTPQPLTFLYRKGATARIQYRRRLGLVIEHPLLGKFLEGSSAGVEISQ